MFRPAALVAVAAGALLSTTFGLPAAQAAPAPGPVDCPTSLPTASAVTGLVGTGWTVERGTEPAPFSATVVGRISNGIAPGVDMIMAELDSPAITRAGGVWAGMSGSPVYAPDGRLIGAVAYGLAASSPIAGITPAASLQTLLSADPDDVRAAAGARIRPDAAGVRALAGTGEVTRTQASAGFSRLRVPLTVTGLRGSSADTVLAALSRRTGQRVLAAGTSAPGAAVPATIFGGSNIAASVAFGDATLAAVGTTTFTCRGKAVAFGHPFLDEGVTTYTAHAASSVLVQPDAVNGPSKIANVLGSVGVVDRDRTLGIRAALGAGPRGTQITAYLTRVENGVRRVGRTTATYQPLLSTAAAVHTVSNLDAVMGSTASRGTARLYLTVRGRTGAGRPWVLKVGQVLAVQPGDVLPLDVLAASWVEDNVAQIVNQPFEAVTVDTINVTGTVSSQAQTWVRPSVHFSQRGRYGTYRQLVSAAGGVLHVRATFSQLHKPSVRMVKKLVVPIPRNARGRDLEVEVAGGAGDDSNDFFGSLFGNPGPAAAEPRSLSDVLAALQDGDRSDRITVTVSDPDTGRVLATRRGRLSLPAAAFSRTADLYVR